MASPCDFWATDGSNIPRFFLATSHMKDIPPRATPTAQKISPVAMCSTLIGCIASVATEDNGQYLCTIATPEVSETRACNLSVAGESLLWMDSDYWGVGDESV